LSSVNEDKIKNRKINVRVPEQTYDLLVNYQIKNALTSLGKGVRRILDEALLPTDR